MSRIPSEDTGASGLSSRQIFGVVAGTALEFYDFSIYAFFAVQIGHAFFPNSSAFVSLMLSLLTYGSGFIARPIGAIVIGRLADRVGRRPAMIVTFSLMGSAMLGLALTPTYAAIGVLAPILAVVWRLCQGLAMGGESGPTMALLVEAAPAHRRGEYGAWMYFSHGVGALLGGLVGVTIAMAGADNLDEWGWRLAFLLGAGVLPIGIMLRRALPETLQHADLRESSPAREASGQVQIKLIALCFVLLVANTVGAQILSYTTTYAITALHMPADVSLAGSVSMGVAYMLGTFLAGRLSDRWGRKFFLVWPRLAFTLMAVPAYWLMARNRDAPTLLLCIAALTVVMYLASTATIIAMTEALPKKTRGTTGGIMVAVCLALLGATTQPTVAWLIHETGPLAPGWYLAAFNVFGLIAGLMMKETAPPRLAPATAQARASTQDPG